MPFDSTTYRPATADPLDLDAMIAWLETMPAEGEYDYDDCTTCAICGFLRARGYSNPVVWIDWWAPTRPPSHAWDHRRYSDASDLPAGWNDAVATAPHTYGAALSRFKALREGRT